MAGVPLPQPPGWVNDVSLVLPGPPTDQDLQSIPHASIRQLLRDVDAVPQSSLWTDLNVHRIAAVLTGASIDRFVSTVARVVGFQPVPQKALRNTADGAIDLGEDAYIGGFLKWGTENREAFKRVMFTFFNHYGDRMQTNINTAIAANAMNDIDVVDRAKYFLQTHSPEAAFMKYLTAVPKPSAVSDSPFTMSVPSYDVRQLADIRQSGAGISNSRMRAMQRGFYRMERLYTAMIWIKRIGIEMQAAKAAVSALRLPLATINSIRDAGMAVAVAAGGAGGAAVAPVAANRILRFLFEEPAGDDLDLDD